MDKRIPENLYGPLEYSDLYQLDKPLLTVVIDTEEEFPWHEPHNRENTSISAIADVHRVQNIFDSFGVIPCYVIDYAVANNGIDHAALKKISDDGRCIIGLHLHPWLSPPYSEEVNNFNSFPGNLPEKLEFEKLAHLKGVIEEKFGTAVNIYKAGRYGVGVNTGKSLAKLGIKIDLSATPGFDYSSNQGPDYSCYSNTLFMFGEDKEQLCIPCTGGLIGWGGSIKPKLYKHLNRKPWISLRSPGVAARLGLVERIRLSPEGFTLDEMKKLTESLLCTGQKVFTLSFHSPTVKLGCTPYVNNNDELKEFLARIEGYLDYFSNELGGEFSHPEQIYKMIVVD